MIEDTLRTAVIAYNWLILGYFLVLNLVYLVCSILAFRVLRRYASHLRAVDVEDLVAPDVAPPVTLIAPMFNEERDCVTAVRAMLELDYAHHEIIVVNDGSTDTTRDRLALAFELVPYPRMPTSSLPTQPVRNLYRSRRHRNLWMLDKANGGKADALNAGLNICHTPYYCAIDGDTILERDALKRLIRPFLEDERVIAAGGIIRIANGCGVRAGRIRDVALPRTLLGRLQVVEYLRAFLAGRTGWGSIGAPLIISGAFGLFHRSVVVDAGGYRTSTVGEDMELVIRLHRHCRNHKIDYRIPFVADPIGWTEVPETLAGLARQRDRWQRGLAESLWEHRGMFMNPRYGTVGLLAYPFYFLFELLGPVVEMLGYAAFIAGVALGIVPMVFVGAFFAVAFLWGVALSVAAIGLGELTLRRYPRTGDMIRLMMAGVYENFGYRQLVTWWRFVGVLNVRRRRRVWGDHDRAGFGTRRAA